MTTVEVIDLDSAERRRAELVAKLDGGEDILRARAAEYRLSAPELAVLDELDELDFLLGK